MTAALNFLWTAGCVALVFSGAVLAVAAVSAVADAQAHGEGEA